MHRRFISFMLCALLFFLSVAGFSRVSALDESLPSFDNYEEYLAYFEGLPHPDIFIDYESISNLGQFERFALDTRSDSNLLRYIYALSDANGYSATLEIYHYDPWNNAITADFTAKLPIDGISTLRKHPSEALGHIVINHCTYCYNESGELNSIRWESNGIYFQLRCEEIQDDNLHDNADTLMNRLLSMDSAEDATQELLEIAKGKLTYKTQAIVAGIVGIVALIVIGDILYRIHRRREKIPAEPMDI